MGRVALGIAEADLDLEMPVSAAFQHLLAFSDVAVGVSGRKCPDEFERPGLRTAQQLRHADAVRAGDQVMHGHYHSGARERVAAHRLCNSRLNRVEVARILADEHRCDVAVNRRFDTFRELLAPTRSADGCCLANPHSTVREDADDDVVLLRYRGKR